MSEERLHLTLREASTLLRRAMRGSGFFVRVPVAVDLSTDGGKTRTHVASYVPISRDMMQRLLQESVAMALGIPVAQLTRSKRDNARIRLTVFAKPNGEAYDYWL